VEEEDESRKVLMGTWTTFKKIQAVKRIVNHCYKQLTFTDTSMLMLFIIYLMAFQNNAKLTACMYTIISLRKEFNVFWKTKVALIFFYHRKQCLHFHFVHPVVTPQNIKFWKLRKAFHNICQEYT
jgi:hypothetical protein